MTIKISPRLLMLMLVALILYLLVLLTENVSAEDAIIASSVETAIEVTPSGGTRDDLRRLLHVPECPAGAQLQSIESENDLARVVFDVCGVALSGLYAPGDAGFVMVVHGTASTPEAAFGLTPDDYMHELARTLNESGYAVFAPEILTQPYGSEDINAARNEADRRLRPVGRSLVGNELMALTAILDYYGGGAVYGISLGGYLAFHTCALSDAVTACGVSGYIEDRAGKLIGAGYPQPYWRETNSDYMTVDGYLLLFDDVQVATLISAPLYVETGALDPRSAYVGDVVEWMLDAGVDATNYIGEGGHETYSAAFMAWLEGV